jgi:hypothetical protein
MRLKGNNEAEEGNDGSSAGSVGLVGRTLEGSGRLDGASARRSGGTSGSAVAVRSLDLTVGDLSDRADGGCSLDLAVGDLGDSGASGGGSAGLDLTIRDLGDGSAGGSSGAGLNLSVGNLAHGSTGCASLDLTVGNLGDTVWLLVSIDENDSEDQTYGALTEGVSWGWPSGSWEAAPEVPLTMLMWTSLHWSPVVWS